MFKNKFAQKFAVIFTALSTIMLVASGSASHAFATQQQICGNGGSGYCMNNWSNSGNVKMEYGGATYEDFQAIELTGMCNGGRVTDNCPFSNTSYDTTEANDGAIVVQIEYAPWFECITGSGADAVIGTCAANNGTGGANGVIQVLDSNRGGCNQGSEGILFNRYATNTSGQLSVVQSGGNPGKPLLLNYRGAEGTYTCWGNI